ncbi:MAG: sulfurtransferase TusA family protein [Xanthobacteraceae bacterium]
MLESTGIAVMIRTIDGFDDSYAATVKVTEKTLNLRGLKCPLPALRTRKALAGMQPGEILIVECTDPLAGIDIPNLINQTGDTLEASRKEKRLLTFRIQKK